VDGRGEALIDLLIFAANQPEIDRDNGQRAHHADEDLGGHAHLQVGNDYAGRKPRSPMP
jgi:hypothetical protein